MIPLRLVLILLPHAKLKPPPFHPRNAVARAAAHAHLHGVVTQTSRGRVEREAGLKQGIQQDAEGPGVGGAPVVGLAHDDFRGGVVVRAAAGFELFVETGNAAREAEVGEGDEGVRVGGPVGWWGGGEFGGGEVDEDVWKKGLVRGAKIGVEGGGGTYFQV